MQKHTPDKQTHTHTNSDEYSIAVYCKDATINTCISAYDLKLANFAFWSFASVKFAVLSHNKLVFFICCLLTIANLLFFIDFRQMCQ